MAASHLRNENENTDSDIGVGASRNSSIGVGFDNNNYNSSTNNNEEDLDSYGPVTRLAHRAAAQDEAARAIRQQQQLHEQRAKLQATALAVGEAAWVIANATTATTTTQPQVMASKSSSLKNINLSSWSPSSSLIQGGGQAYYNNDDFANGPSARTIISPIAAAPRRKQILRQTPPPRQNDDDHHDEGITSSNSDNYNDCDRMYSFSSFEGRNTNNNNDDDDGDPCCQPELQSSPSMNFGQPLVKSKGKPHGQQPDPTLCAKNHVVGHGEDDSGGLGGGLFASAKNWLQSQRERLHQLELERQVEDQRRKLVEEGRKQRAREAEERRRRTHRFSEHHHQQQLHHRSAIVDTAVNEGRNHSDDGQWSVNNSNVAFHSHNMVNEHDLGEITTTSSTTITTGTNTPPSLFLPLIIQDELCILPHIQGEMCSLSQQQNRLAPPSNNNNNNNNNKNTSSSSPYFYSAASSSSSSNSRPSFMCGFGSAYDYNPEMDEDNLVVADYPGVARVDSYGNILEMIPSGSLDDENGEIEHHIHEEGRLGVVGKKKVYMSVSSPRWTCSGEGMSVKVDVDDFNDDSTCDDDDDEDDDDNRNIRSTNKNLESDDSTHPIGNKDGLRVAVEREDDPYFVSDIKIVPETPKTEISSPSSAIPSILRPSHMKSLIESGGLPPSLTFCKWKRLYSLIRDGDSFEQFLHLVEGHDRTVLVVKTTLGKVFGGFADTRWEARHMRRHASEYYGSAQAFLFRFPNYRSSIQSSEEEVEEVSKEGKSVENDVIIYKWSGVNRYIQLCDASRRTIALGGGGQDGDFGLCIEDDFRRGTTGTCSTFANEALCEEGYFFVMDLEVWGFTLDF